jgi:hypothetical protein
MGWMLLAAIVVAVVLWQARRKRSSVGPSDPISTFNVVTSKRHSAKTKAALDSATASLK